MSPLANISVVIPVFNSSEKMLNGVDSICSQTLLPKEIIIIDDASNDDFMANYKKCIDKLKLYSIDLILIKNREQMGPSYCRNRGIFKASNDFIAFLDSDDIWHIDKLKLQMKVMLSNPEVYLSGHFVMYETRPCMVEKNKVKVELTYKKLSKLQCLVKNPLKSASTYMMRRNSNILFNVEQRYAEDYRFLLQHYFSGKQVYILNSVLSYSFKRPFGDTGLSSRIVKMELYELSNYFFLYNNGHIGFWLLFFSCAFSVMKFFRRFCIVIGYKLKYIFL
tara:strand:- start:602 stop:1435 length:834 start_codon:yes stop_codon:yes gene_type:complete